MTSPVSEDQIRKRAYELWEQSGRGDQSEADFWLQAEQELQSQQQPAEPSDGPDARGQSQSQ